MTVKKVFSADEIRQDIRWVILLRDPCHFDLLLADGSLQPEERHRHVPDLPDASPPADAPASRAIRVDPYLQVDPEILCHGLHRETLSPALDRGVVLGLASPELMAINVWVVLQTFRQAPFHLMPPPLVHVLVR